MTYLPSTVFNSSKNSSAPVPVQQLGALGVNVITYSGDVRLEVGGADQFAGFASDVGYKSGSFVIKGYENNVQRGAQGPNYPRYSGKAPVRNNVDLYPAGLYLESSQPSVASKFVAPLAEVLQVIKNGGFIYVFLNCTRNYGAGTNLGVASTTFLKNGVVQSGTNTVANAGTTDVWAQVQVLSPGNAPIQVGGSPSP